MKWILRKASAEFYSKSTFPICIGTVDCIQYYHLEDMRCSNIEKPEEISRSYKILNSTPDATFVKMKDLKRKDISNSICQSE